MAKRYDADQWRAWFVEFEQSSLTVAKFCESIGVSVQSYYKWRRELKSVDELSAPTVKGASFVPVVVHSTMPTSVVEIELPGGVIARVPNDTDSLRPILSVLLNRESVQ